jgi:hypothetical protein
MKTERDHSSVYLTVSSCEPRPALAVDGGILKNAFAILVAQIALSCGGCKKNKQTMNLSFSAMILLNSAKDFDN